MVKIAPSILSADFGRLAEDVKKVEKHVDLFHFDAMDGHFVPNITFGPDVLAAVRKATKKPIDAHLMIAEPARYIEPFVTSGADMVSVHAETDPHLHRTLGRIRELGAKAGVALNPSTPLAAVENVLDSADYLLIMTVNPGFGGQAFIASMLPKITAAQQLIEKHHLKMLIEVDGGITAETAKQSVRAGADILVAGSYIYHSRNPAKAAEALRNAANS